MSLLEHSCSSFIVRIWGEPVAQATDALRWRGSVEHVGTGQRRYFHDFAALNEFIRLWMKDLPTGSANTAH